MSKNSEHVKKWRKESKNRMVAAMGGSCVCCGYNRCNDALDFHHINPQEKEFSFSKVMANPKSWTAIVKELRKCALVCSVCHREIEAGIRLLPDNFAKFDETFVKYRETREPIIKYCKICKTEFSTFSKSQRLCSPKCAEMKNRKTVWPSKEELKILIENNSWCAIGRMFGVTDNAVRKWARSYNLLL